MAPLVAGYLGAASRDLKAAEVIADARDPDLAATAAHHLQPICPPAAERLMTLADECDRLRSLMYEREIRNKRFRYR